MKKSIIFLLAVALIVVSCKKDEDDDVKIEPKEFSKLEPEEHKADIQNSAIELIDEVNDLATSEGTEAIVQIVMLMDSSSTLKSAKASPAGIMYNISDLSDNKITITDFMFNYSKMEEEEGDENIQEIYDEIKGTYTYNFETEDFDEATGDQLVIIFPSTADATVNDATFTVTEFKTESFTSELLEEIEGVLPTSIKAQLTIGGTPMMDYSFSEPYKSDGTPTSLSSSLTISGFTFSTAINNKDDSDVSWEAAFKNGENNIISGKVGIKGKFTEQNLKDNTHYVIEECVYDQQTMGENCTEEEVTKEVYEATEEGYFDNSSVYKWEEVDIENILSSSYAYLDIFNIRLGGELNAKEMIPEIKTIDDDWEVANDEYWENYEEGDGSFNEKPFEERYTEAMNEYTSFFVSYLDKNQKIANVEFYVAEGQDSIFDYECEPIYNGDLYVGEDCNLVFEGMETYYYTDGRMVFGDDSKITAETYFEEGFSSFFDKVNELIGTINETYDADIDPVVYEEVFE